MRTAAEAASLDMTNEFTARNAISLQELVNNHGVELREFPDDLLIELNRISQGVIDGLEGLSPIGAKIHASYREYEANVAQFHSVSEEAYTRARKL